jgi:hypothetical protein
MTGGCTSRLWSRSFAGYNEGIPIKFLDAPAMVGRRTRGMGGACTAARARTS